ncbi:MAG: hypothetical protein K2X50_00105 [Gammaproteobacteria bacterium]|nr:hypothetical protein [Gammaproteobacteria bacterium]
MDNNDHIRERILEYLYARNHNSRGVPAISAGIRDIQGSLKKKYGYKQQQVNGNINYLIDKGWVKKEITQKEITKTPGVKIPAQSIKYRISADGIDYWEGPSKFQNNNILPFINIHNVSGIVTVGDFNTIVNNKYVELLEELENFHRVILNENTMPDDVKLNLSSDVASLKSQLSKTTPEKSLIMKLWNTITDAVTAYNFSNIVLDIASKIHELFPS